MLEHTVDDAADTKGRLDDVRHELLLLSVLGLGGEADHFTRQLELLAFLGRDLDGLSLGDLGSEGSLGLLVSVLKEIDDELLLLLELLADDLLVENGDSGGDSDGLGEAAGSHELNLGLLHVLSEIEGGAIGVSSDLDPAVARLDLSIPAIVGVMGHLVRAVLAEANGLALDADSAEELVGPGQEVADGLIADHAATHGLANGHHDWLALVILLSDGAEKRHFSISKTGEFGVALVLGVYKMLNLSHGEFTDA
mmetsp:Transcript_37929/g.46221  ORF Transcript_37929/g.46221 Transcript_37929/m.46221 type:complete len:253 (+) Transcript_37929:740-1498(+)